MKRIAFFFLFLLVLFGGSFALGRHKEKGRRELSSSNGGEILFHPNPYTLLNRPFVFIVVGHNNGAAAEKNIESIFSQQYAPFRLIYIDDGSDDGSYSLVKELIQGRSERALATIVRHEQRKGELESIYEAIQTCPDGEIAVLLGGDDWLAHEWVLKRLNEYYADPDLWAAFGHYREFPSYCLGGGKLLSPYSLNLTGRGIEKGIRGQLWNLAHLKTFRVALFKNIRKTDLQVEGQFLPAAIDLAIVFPLLELAKDHSCFIPETLYISNRRRTSVEDRGAALYCERYVRSLPSYPPLNRLTAGNL